MPRGAGRRIQALGRSARCCQRSSQAQPAAVDEQVAQRLHPALGGVGQQPPGQREVDLPACAAGPASRPPACASSGCVVARPSLARWPCSSALGEPAGEGVDDLGGARTAAVGVVGQQRQQRLGQARQVPARDQRLVAVGVAAAVVDAAEHRAGS
jgi:hypothetical protein